MKYPAWKSIRWKRIILVLLPIALFLSAPYWHRLNNPTAYADVRYVMQESDGSVVKGVGRSECVNNGKQTLVLNAEK